MQETRILAILPCYNEQDNLEDLVNEFRNYAPQIDILVVNDCSKDNTATVAQRLGVRLLDLPINLGIGGAVQSGYKFALRNNYDIAIQVDGDGQHPPAEIQKVITPILNQEADIVIGSRFIEKSGFQSTFVRRLGIKYFHQLNRILTGVSVFDSTSGFRAFNKNAIELATRYYPDLYPEPESIVYFAKKGLRIKEVPVVMKERLGGVSSISGLKTIYYMVKVTLGILFVYLRFRKKSK